MTPRTAAVAALLVALLPAPCRAAAPADSAATRPPLVATRALVRQLAASGRAEVSLTRESVDPLSGRAVRLRGRLVLEPPDRVRLDFPDTGERVTLRSDGGEWLQRSLQQMLRLDPAHVAPALRWWRLFLDRGGDRFRERSLGPKEFVVVPRDPAAGGDSVRVVLGAGGLPAQVRVGGPGEEAVYRFADWRFSPARGRADFVLEAPPGVQVIQVP